MKKVKLGDLLVIKQGYAFKSEKYINNGNYVLCTLGNFSENNDFKFIRNKATYYSDDFPHEFILREGDLVMPLTEQVIGLFGNTAFIPDTDGFNFVLNQRVGKVIPDESKVDKYYLHYLLSTDLVRNQIESTASGTKQRNTSPDKIYDVDVWIPSITEQRKIGGLLFDIEKKIKVNNKINDNLQQQLRMLYYYWFVQCNFPDKDGNPYRNNGGLTYNDSYLKRPVPNDWCVKDLSSIGTIVSGGTPSTSNPEYYTEHGIPWITPNDLSNNTSNIYINHGERDITEAGLNNSSATLMPSGAVLLSTRAPIGYIAISESDVCTNQGFKSVVPNKGYSSAFIYFTLLDMLPHIHHLGSGTTFKEVSKDSISSMKVLMPPHDVVKQFDEMAIPLLTKCKTIQEQNRTLLDLRNWLLPMLMNGQATIAD